MRLRRRSPPTNDQTTGGRQGKPGGSDRMLEIFVLPSCIACQTAIELAERMSAVKPPGVFIRLIDLSLPGTLRPATVFAVPTYLLDGRVVSLGNPDPDWLLSQLSPASPSK